MGIFSFVHLTRCYLLWVIVIQEEKNMAGKGTRSRESPLFWTRRQESRQKNEVGSGLNFFSKNFLTLLNMKLFIQSYTYAFFRLYFLWVYYYIHFCPWSKKYGLVARSVVKGSNPPQKREKENILESWRCIKIVKISINQINTIYKIKWTEIFGSYALCDIICIIRHHLHYATSFALCDIISHIWFIFPEIFSTQN